MNRSHTIYCAPSSTLPEPPKTITIQRANLELALREAIINRRRAERALGFTQDSILVQGWLEVADAIMQGHRVEVR